MVLLLHNAPMPQSAVCAWALVLTNCTTTFHAGFCEFPGLSFGSLFLYFFLGSLRFLVSGIVYPTAAGAQLTAFNGQRTLVGWRPTADTRRLALC